MELISEGAETLPLFIDERSVIQNCMFEAVECEVETASNSLRLVIIFVALEYLGLRILQARLPHRICIDCLWTMMLE